MQCKQNSTHTTGLPLPPLSSCAPHKSTLRGPQLSGSSFRGCAGASRCHKRKEKFRCICRSRSCKQNLSVRYILYPLVPKIIYSFEEILILCSSHKSQYGTLKAFGTTLRHSNFCQHPYSTSASCLLPGA